ncbi:RNA polymerase sigma factor [Cryobacterium cryoconiti]|uniref:RNA polymerase sigma factor n=1 Tax=Cryobacterium cryoconiti TaxID=1259239 RepID=A0A4Y8JS43_9MICO|nr:RNA polymerase sigma factor [Cryobacterium cryoconiti]TFD28253.1 RNA polymerase sigma factor [Cryobacterium cryoconiti]
MPPTPTREPVSSPLESFPDQVLSDRAADGDMRAFEVLVRRYGPLMRVYASRVLGSNDEMDDVVQESFITAWQQLPTLENGAAVKSWLMRIVSRKSVDRVRARRQHVNIDLTDAPAPAQQSPHRLAEAGSQTEALTRVLAELPEDQRRCWMLRELAECSYGEIAAELEIPVSTVRGLLARARKTLLQEMEEWR